ncbi:DUF2125 domain-containing protein [Chelativorans sp. AA-79]|uniref:DUF2125 domain-containing protein n=1 Tax=Chelativorans sp. AA-79 TaxID=3028735 RepID=UPI0023F62E9A|nr:DUF2125 domain-containing protein [Chelativorans sp. AA-79]WEX10061.1 DUF2125 domain-containing protein [Chelativorans sp. AA-79]
MASRTSSRFGRRILWLAIAIVLVCAAYTGAWFYAARMLESRAVAVLEKVNGGGVRAFCEEPQARGFPFRIGLFCKSIFYENIHDGVSVRAGQLRSAAHVYQPFRVLSEVDGPASIMTPFTVPLRAQWGSLRASTRLTRPLPETVSVEGKAVRVSAEEGGGTLLAEMDDLQVHARQREADLEAALSFRNLRVGEEIVTGLPALEGRMLLLVTDGVALVQNRTRSLRGQSLTIEEMVVGLAGQRAEVSLSGPISVDDEGLIDAELSVGIDDPAAVAEQVARIFPDERDQIMAASGMVGGFAGAPLQIRIVSGRIFLGFIPLGTIPPVD